MRNKPSFTVPSFNPIHIFTTPYPDATDIKLDPNYTSDGKGLALLSSPYANPSRCKDLEWWKEACPQGRTMVTWGGKEMLRDDIIEFVDILDEVRSILLLRLPCRTTADDEECRQEWNQ